MLAEISEAEIIPVAVPNLGPPPPPLASLGPLAFDHDVTTDSVPLDVLVPPGRAAPVAWRVRRSSVAIGDPLRMDVVATGPIPPDSADAEGTHFAIALADTLKPWRHYRFVVEVQAGRPPGAPTAGEIPVGEWSAPSAAVALATIPPHLPEPPSALTITTLANGDARLTVTHPDADALVGTAFGAYRFEVYRLSPGARPAKLALTLERTSGNQFEAVDPAPPPGSAWSVRLLDPLGRPSPSLTVAGGV